VVSRLAQAPPDEIRLCSIVKAELYDGAYRSSRREQNLVLLDRFFQQFISLPFDDQAAQVYGQVRAELSRRGQIIGPNDLLIASIALANSLTLVTHNTREFSRMMGLKIEDWETA